MELLKPRHLLPMAAEALRKAGSYVLEQVQGGGWSHLPPGGMSDTPPAHIEYYTRDGETDDDDPHEHEADL